jgi:hypothetical protein
VVDSDGAPLTRDALASACIAALSRRPAPDAANPKRKRKAGGAAAADPPAPAPAAALASSSKKEPSKAPKKALKKP